MTEVYSSKEIMLPTYLGATLQFFSPLVKLKDLWATYSLSKKTFKLYFSKIYHHTKGSYGLRMQGSEGSNGVAGSNPVSCRIFKRNKSPFPAVLSKTSWIIFLELIFLERILDKRSSGGKKSNDFQFAYLWSFCPCRAIGVPYTKFYKLEMIMNHSCTLFIH